MILIFMLVVLKKKARNPQIFKRLPLHLVVTPRLWKRAESSNGKGLRGQGCEVSLSLPAMAS
jgi:hypothetical protein